MKALSCLQGSPAWHAARLGIATASCFAKIVTPTGKASAQADGYLYQLVAERLIGEPCESVQTQWMARGQITEAEAVAYYELQRGLDTALVGFVTTDDGAAGCSPDRLVGDDGGLEIKCPSAAVHVGYLLDEEPRKYWPQIQGALWITGRAWWDFMSYCPGLPAALTRYERDDTFIAALDREVTAFCRRVDEAHARIAAMYGDSLAANAS